MKYVRFERPDGLVQTGVLETDDRIRAVEIGRASCRERVFVPV